MTRHARSPRRLARWAALVVVALAVVGAAPAYASEGSIDHVQSRAGRLQLLYSVPGAGDRVPDLGSIRVTLDGTDLHATARLASGGRVRRTTVLAIDTSQSMAGAKFAAARRAAEVFLDSVPDDVRVGIVTFAGSVHELQPPSLDRAASHRLLRRLTLSRGTRLYDGLVLATHVAGTAGPRSLLVLSDGRDTSPTTLDTAARAVHRAGVKVDVIALGQSARDAALLTPVAKAGGGSLISAADPAQLRHIFTSEAQALASQLLVTATVPRDGPREGTLSVAVDVGGSSYADAAFVTVSMPHPPAARPAATVAATRLQPASPGFQVSPRMLAVGVVALGAGLLVLLVAIVAGLGRTQQSVEDRIAAYTTRGATQRKADPAGSMTAQAVGVAQRALAGSHGFEAKLAARLDAAGLGLKPAEWLLTHAGIAVAATVVLFGLTGGDPLMALVGLAGGVLVPWVYLGRKQSKRLKAFNSQLAATLQLLAGSLQAGLSIAQGMDTIVREGAEPVAGEFRRALVETRLGVQIEDALDAVATRMTSADFTWTVMAIRIQREVGGNLAELLLNVAATMRERDYLRRQVKSLSAEGRFSAYILLALPPLILAYMYMTNRAYLEPLVASPIGWVMLAAMGLLMGVGAFTMSRMVKLEV